MNSTALAKTDLYQRVQPWLPMIEWGFWPFAVTLNTVFNIIVVQMDIDRSHLNFEIWEPVTWESSSGVAALLLMPAAIMFTRRVPLQFEVRKWIWPYMLFSVLWSILHVGGMVVIRKWIYAAFGKTYDFGFWPREWFYEYLKDLRSVILMVGIIEGYRFVIRRMQGEASLLDPNEEEPIASTPITDRFLVKKLGREFLVSATEIEFAQAAGNYVNLHVRGHDYPIRSTIAELENKLDRACFVRVHRSYIVSINWIASIEPIENGDARLHLKNQLVIPCSRTYRNTLKALFV